MNTDTSKEQEAAEAMQKLVREMKESTSGTDKKLHSPLSLLRFLQ